MNNDGWQGHNWTDTAEDEVADWVRAHSVKAVEAIADGIRAMRHQAGCEELILMALRDAMQHVFDLEEPYKTYAINELERAIGSDSSLATDLVMVERRA